MEEEKISYNGQEYDVADLSEKGRYFVVQLKNLTQLIENTKITLDQQEIAYKSFSTLLGEEIVPNGTTAEEFVAE